MAEKQEEIEVIKQPAGLGGLLGLLAKKKDSGSSTDVKKPSFAEMLSTQKIDIGELLKMRLEEQKSKIKKKDSGTALAAEPVNEINKELDDILAGKSTV